MKATFEVSIIIDGNKVETYDYKRRGAVREAFAPIIR